MKQRSTFLFPLAAVLLLALLLPLPLACGQTEIVLAADGRAALPIVLGPERSQRIVEDPVLAGWGQFEVQEIPSAQCIERAARTLATFLGRISGGSYDLIEGDGRKGIALGLYSDFPALKLESHFDPQDRLRREEYLIRSHDQGLYLIGATELAVEHAVWDLLGRLGYRQFFPGSVWEHVPQKPSLSITIDTFQAPAYHSRLIWYGGGILEENAEEYRNWAQRNRAVAGFRLNTSHEYNRIRARHAEAFAANPDFYAMVDGKRSARSHAKFNVANPQLRNLVVEDALQWFKDHPHEVSKSMDPSDFGFWDESEEAAAIGTPTDQALHLANLVAEQVNTRLEGARYVGMYAYYAHQPPPTRESVHPNVIVSFATRFLRSRQTVDELVSSWRERGLQSLGIRAYGSVFYWDWALPSLSFQGGSLGYLVYKIPHYHQLGARFYTSESSNSWGPIGLGHYVTARMLWDIQEAEALWELVDDFLDTMFGPAREPMARFYDRIAGSQRPLARDNVSYDLYRFLKEAYALTSDPLITDRLDVLTQYVHYIELFEAYAKATGEARQTAFEALMRHAYRIRLTNMIHIMPLYHREAIVRQDKSVTVPAEAKWSVPEENNPWKSSEPFSRQELDHLLEKGLTRLAADTFDHSRLVPADLKAAGQRSARTLNMRQSVSFLLHAREGEEAQTQVDCRLLDFSVGPLYAVLSPEGEIIQSGQLEINEQATIAFVAPSTGTYRITFDNTPNILRASSDLPLGMLLQDYTGRWGRVHLKRPVGRVYFHVPEGVDRCVIQVAGEGKGELVNAILYDPSGQVMEQAENISGERPHDFVIAPPAGSGGSIWSLELARPTSGYFGDAFIQLDEQLAPVLSLSPEAVFTRRPDR